MKKCLVVLAACALVFAYTVPAMAVADWNFYGSSRMQTFWDRIEPPGDGDSDTDVTWKSQVNSRIGAKVKAGDIEGRFEFGVKGTPDGNGIYTRILYGAYKMGEGKLVIGQSYTPVSGMFYSNMVWGGDEDLLSFGQCYGGRRPMIQYSIKGFQVALVSPNAPAISGLPAGGDTDVILPRLELKYSLKQEKFFMDFFGGVQTYSVDYTTTDYDVTSFVGGLGGGVSFGPAYFKASGYYALNGGAWGLAGAGVDDPYYSAAKDDIVDVDTFGVMGVFGVKANDTITIETGAGYIAHEYDVDNSEKDDALAVYLNCTVNIAPGFFIVPEVGYIDYGDDHAGNEEMERIYWGAKWQINF